MSRPWGATRTLLRHELRRWWRSFAVLGVAAGLLFGAAALTAEVAWRTDTAHDRLVRQANLDDVRVEAIPLFTARTQDAVVAAVRRAADTLIADPGVTGVQRNTFLLVRMEPQLDNFPLEAVQVPYGRDGGVNAPAVVRGRAPDPGRVDEMMVTDDFARAHHLRIGRVLQVGVYTLRESQKVNTDPGVPGAGHVRMHITGVYRTPVTANQFSDLVAGPAFYRRFGAQGTGDVLFLRTRDAAATRALAARSDALNQRLVARFGPAFEPYLTTSTPRLTPDPSVGPTRTVLRSGLLALVAVLALAAVVVLVQVATRWAEAEREQHVTESALGVPYANRVAARVAAGAPVVLLAAAATVAGGLLGGTLPPVGALGRYEPTPGTLVDPAVVTGCTLAAAAVTALVLVLAVLRAGRTRPAAGARRPRATTRLRAGAATRLGLALAAARGARAGGSARPVAVGTALLVVLAVVGVGVHGALDGIAHRPAQWGWTSPYILLNTDPSVERMVARDPRVAAADTLIDGPVRLRSARGTHELLGYGRTPTKGVMPYTVAQGRVPRRPGEIAYGLRAAQDAGVHVGSDVTLLGRHGHRREHVVGLVTLTQVEYEPVGLSVLLTAADHREYARAPGFREVLVHPRPGAAKALAARLATVRLVTYPTLPANIDALDRLSAPLAFLVATLAVALLLLQVQGLVLLRRRRGGQLRIAEAVGMPRARLRAAVGAAVLLTTGRGVLAGVLLGWAVARVFLAEIGPRLGVQLALPGAGLLLAALAVLAVATAAVALVAAALGVPRPRPALAE